MRRYSYSNVEGQGSKQAGSQVGTNCSRLFDCGLCLAHQSIERIIIYLWSHCMVGAKSGTEQVSDHGECDSIDIEDERLEALEFLQEPLPLIVEEVHRRVLRERIN